MRNSSRGEALELQPESHLLAVFFLLHGTYQKSLFKCRFLGIEMFDILTSKSRGQVCSCIFNAVKKLFLASSINGAGKTGQLHVKE